MALYNSLDIESWERFCRANFINTLTGFKSVSLIGTINKAGQSNLGIFSSIVHIVSNPPLIGYINRPLSAAPHTNVRDNEIRKYLKEKWKGKYDY